MGVKTKIDWCDSTWNPVTGCLHGCEYCYARKIAERFGGFDCTKDSRPVGWELAIGNQVLDEPKYTDRSGKLTVAPYPWGFLPTFHRYKLDEPKGWRKPRNVFVCSMADLFGKWVPDEWIEAVFDACREAPQHRYLFLTKNPARYYDLGMNRRLPEDDNFWYGTTVTTPEERYFISDKHNCFVSVEPILQDFGEGDFHRNLKWVIIGAETGRRKDKVVPKKEWIDNIA